jgi:hypothetical protein
VPAIFRNNPIEVTNRLDELGWTREDLLEIAQAMVEARNSCTDNDPASAPGWMSWKAGTRRMREIGRTKGLEKADIDQIPCLLDQTRKLRFSVVNTDDGTGIEGRVPQNQSKKGAGTDRAVNDNQDLLFDAADVPVVPLSSIGAQPGIVVSWLLLVHSAGDVFRAEFSCPIEISGGFFADFSERNVLIGPNDDGGNAVRRNKPDWDGGSEFEIPVSRK